MENILLGQILKKPFQTLILSGNVQDLVFSIETFFKKEEELDIQNHGDILFRTIDSLSIDVAREIKEWTEGMPQYREQKLLVLAPTIFPYISQNALLKTFEEPSGNTQIILIVKELSILLPTIISRAVIYNIPSQEKIYDNELLKLVPHKRLAHPIVVTLLKTGLQKPTKEKVTLFFDNLICAVLKAPYSDVEKREAVSILTTATPYIYDQGASIKMLVEFVCLQLPVLKD